MALHTMPESLPADWIASKKLPSSEGSYEAWNVVHPTQGGYHPFVLHRAWYIDEGESKGTFSYAYGVYCKTLEEAMKAFEEKIA